MPLEECKCIVKEKEVIRHITEDLETSCDEEFSGKFLMYKTLLDKLTLLN